MKTEGMIENASILKYLNRLSDLIFVLACFEQRSMTERPKVNRALFSSYWSDPAARKMLMAVVGIILTLITVIVFIMIFHRPTPDWTNTMGEHMQDRGTLKK